MSRRVVVVGGGLSGLSLAYRLGRLEPSLTVTVLESASVPGGNIGTRIENGYVVERGPNGFLDNKPATYRLALELGLEGELVAGSESARKNRFVYWNNALRKLPGSFGSFLRSDLLSWRSKLRILTEKYRSRPKNTPEDESIAAFATRRIGKEAADLLADTMTTGIHAGDPELLSLSAAFPRVAGWERDVGSVMRGMSAASKARRKLGSPPQRMWSFRGGLQTLIDALTATCDVRTSSPVEALEHSETGWMVRTARETFAADAVVLACPAAVQSRLLVPIDALLAESVGRITYNRVAVVAVGFHVTQMPSVPDGFGYIAPQRTRRDVLGVQWCSSIYPDRAPAGHVLWRALCGGWNRGDMLDRSDAELVAAVVAEVKLAHGVTGEPTYTHVVRWERAIPQYFVGHSARVRAIESQSATYPGLYLAGNAYHGVAMNDCTERAEIIAPEIVRFLGGLPMLR